MQKKHLDLTIKISKTFVFVLALQLFVSISFLSYIHIKEGAPRGDYGRTYRYKVPHTK